MAGPFPAPHSRDWIIRIPLFLLVGRNNDNGLFPKASLCGHYEVVQLLLDSGALCERDTFQGERCFPLLFGFLFDFLLETAGTVTDALRYQMSVQCPK